MIHNMPIADTEGKLLNFYIEPLNERLTQHDGSVVKVVRDQAQTKSAEVILVKADGTHQQIFRNDVVTNLDLAHFLVGFDTALRVFVISTKE